MTSIIRIKGTFNLVNYHSVFILVQKKHKMWVKVNYIQEECSR